jgi:hypothetical protein
MKTDVPIARKALQLGAVLFTATLMAGYVRYSHNNSQKISPTNSEHPIAGTKSARVFDQSSASAAQQGTARNLSDPVFSSTKSTIVVRAVTPPDGAHTLEVTGDVDELPLPPPSTQPPARDFQAPSEATSQQLFDGDFIARIATVHDAIGPQPFTLSPVPREQKVSLFDVPDVVISSTKVAPIFREVPSMQTLLAQPSAFPVPPKTFSVPQQSATERKAP